jgi:manganese-dependent ADP-ribose/CDP-alcohol diphosphatase
MKFLVIAVFLFTSPRTFSMRNRAALPLRSISIILQKSRTIKIFSRRLHSSLKAEDVSSADSSLFSFGVIADIQYVDAPDAMNFQNTTMRRYRQSFDTFKDAITSWDQLVEPPKCAIVLGDILDGKSATMMNQEKCINDVLQASSGASYEMLYCFGNHCHYSFSREDLFLKLSPRFLLSEVASEVHSESKKSTIDPSFGGTCSPSKLFYDWSPYPDWRFISLDCYDISLIGASSEGNKKIAEDLLAKNNPNDLTIGSGWFNGLSYDMRRWVPYNGGISTEQLNWLKIVLKRSNENNEKVVIFCHQPVYAPNKPQSLVWNAEETLAIIREHGNVVIWIAGHDHGGQVGERGAPHGSSPFRSSLIQPSIVKSNNIQNFLGVRTIVCNILRIA